MILKTKRVLNMGRLYFKDTLSVWEIRLAHCQTFYLHWWTAGKFSKVASQKKSLLARLFVPLHRHKHVPLQGPLTLWATEMRENSCSSPAPFPEQARNRSRALSSAGLLWLSLSLGTVWSKCDTRIPWRPRAGAVPEQGEYKVASSCSHSSKEPELWLQIVSLKKKSGLLIFIF